MIDYRPEQAISSIRHEFGRRLRLQRLARGLRQTDLAEASGVGEATIRRIEEGSTDARLGVLIRLLRALDLLDGLEALVPDLSDSPLLDADALPERMRRPATAVRDDGWQWNDDASQR